MKTVKKSLQNKKMLLFDIDGTLLDSKSFLLGAAHRTMDQFYPGAFSRDFISERFGMGFAQLLPGIDPRLDEQARQSFYRLKLESYHLQSPPFPGVVSGLRTLKQHGYRLAIVTNQHRQIVLQGIEAAGIAPLFETVVALEDVAAGKPSPEGIELALRQMTLSAADCVFVGDSLYDVAAAREAALDSVLLDWYSEGLVEARRGADFVFNDFSGLMELALHHRTA